MQMQKEMIRNTISTYMCGSLEAEGVTVAGKGTPSPLPSSSPLSLSDLKIIFGQITQYICYNNFVEI